MPLDHGHRRGVEAVADERGELRTARPPAVPQDVRADRRAEPRPQAEQELVGVVGGDAEFVGDLGRGEPVPQVQVEQARVAFAQGHGSCVDQPVAIGGGDDVTRVAGPACGDGAAGAGIEQVAHRLALLRPGSAVPLEPVEGPVAGDAQQPPAERVDLFEPVDAFPGGDEGVLRDVGSGVG